MDILIFLYNIFLLILFVVTGTFSFIMFMKKKTKVYLIISVMYIVNVFDNTITYMTEFIDWFSSTYDTQFMTIPAFKTIILIFYSACILLILNEILQIKLSYLQAVALLTLSMLLMFIPMLQNSAYKVWLYYLPCQLFQFWLSLYGLHIMRKQPDQYTGAGYNILSKALKITTIFSILILLEDTIVIFNLDTYTDLLVRINNRNISEDCLSVIYCFFLLGYTFHQILAGESNGLKATTSPIIHHDPLEQFCFEKDLTAREKDIFALLVKDKNNQEISEALSISVGTVKTHVHNIFGKLDVAKRSQVLRTYHDFLAKEEMVQAPLKDTREA